MDDNKIFSIHFPGKKVYIENTYGTIEEKIKKLKMIKIIFYILILIQKL